MTLTQKRQPTLTLRRQRLTLLGHAFVVWALCAATMMIGLAVASEETALIAHAIGAPIFAAAGSWNYFKRFGYYTPLQVAAAFVGFVIVVDSFLVAPVIEGSFEMFTSPLGTWIPFAHIFGSAYLTGRTVLRRDGYAPQRR